jgi:glycosyltransferase involved in cell wall biosynthesis
MSSTESIDLTFVVIAYNEAELLEATILEIQDMLASIGRQAPILIMNDGSTDATPAIANELSERFENTRCYHHPENVGQWANIRKGIELTETTYYVSIPGDNQFEMASFHRFLPFLGQYDILFGFPNNEYERGRTRTFLSHLWRLYLLTLFGISVTYLAGVVVAPRALVLKMNPENEGFLGWYETAVRLVLSGASYIQIPFEIRDRTAGESKAFRPARNIRDLGRMLNVWRRIKGPGVLPQGSSYEGIRAAYDRYLGELEEQDAETAREQG